MMILICIKQHLMKFEAQFIKKLNKTEVKLKKGVTFKKSV